jgi:hypothetical protein
MSVVDKAKEFVQDNFLVEKEVADKRYEICKSCDRFFKFTNQCKECGCVMRAKTKIKGQVCPLGKW